VTSSIFHVSPADWAAVRGLDAPERERLELLADLCRIDTLYMVRRAGSGHLGSSFSSLDIVSWVYRDALLTGAPSDAVPTYFSSKGHDVPGLYCLLMACGILPPEKLHQLRRLGGLPGHPDVRTPGMVTNSGSLGMGISKAKGLIEAARLRGERRPIVVMTGDGELQEGQIWESLGGAVKRGMSELRVVVDHNKIQSDTLVELVSPLGDLEAKFAAFGWATRRVDGHDLGALAAAFDALAEVDGPAVIVADTVKGRGVSFMEGMIEGDELYQFHSGAPDLETYSRALGELRDRVDARLTAYGVGGLQLVEHDFTPPAPPSAPQRMVPAYSEALLAAARADDRVVALDGDLALDTGLLPLAAELPDRFLECGIAEQDMVGQAGGLALGGMLPVVHSFASFLTPRAAEQISTNASEGTKVVYVGSLAGILPGGPGHSHQMIRDLALMSSVPGMVCAEPCLADEVGPVVELLLSDAVERSAYLRLVSIPVEVPFSLPEGYRARVGHGWTVREGRDLVVLGSGPVVLSQLASAADRLATEGLDVKVLAMPWINVVDAYWFAEAVDGIPTVVTVENHLLTGGLAASVRAALDALPGHRFAPIGMTDLPESGQNDEILAHHRLDAASLAERLRVLAQQSAPASA
jgi:transketolase